MGFQKSIRFHLPNSLEPYLAVAASMGISYLCAAPYNESFSIPANFYKKEVLIFFLFRLIEIVCSLWGSHQDSIDLISLLLCANIPEILINHIYYQRDFGSLFLQYAPQILILPAIWTVKNFLYPSQGFKRIPGEKYPLINRPKGIRFILRTLFGAIFLAINWWYFAQEIAFPTILQYYFSSFIPTKGVSIVYLIFLMILPAYGIQRVAGDLEFYGIIQFVAVIRAYESSKQFGDKSCLMPIIAFIWGVFLATLGRLLPHY